MPRFKTSSAAWLAAALLAALPIAGQTQPAKAPTPEQIRKEHAELKAENKLKDKEQIDGYLRSVPSPRGPEDEESETIRVHAAREWYLLTYPTGTLPSQPWDRARKWVSKRVADAQPWPGPGLQSPFERPDGEDGAWEKVLIPPGTNTWVSYGPRPLDSVGTTNNAYRYGTVAGRVSVGGLAVDPNNPGVAYAGFVAGGLWKTTTLGLPVVTWIPLWDDKDFVTQSAGAIEIDPTNSNVLYAGTGDWAASDQFGAGIMKSTDGGLTWAQLGASVFTPYSPTHPAGGNRWANQNLRTIQVDPNNPSKILAGTRYDLYISHDAGSTWQICGFGNGYTNPAASNPTQNAINRISSIYLDGRGGSTVAYVAVGYYLNSANGNNGVYRFNMPASGCPAWPSGFTTLFGGFPANTGNGVNGNVAGGSSTGRIELAGATGPDGKLTLYAQVSEAVNTTAEGTYVLRPDGGATTWTKLSGSTSTAYKDCTNGSSGTGQDWYDLFIAVDSSDDKTLYIGHIDAFKATVNSTYTSMTLSNLTTVYSTGCPAYGKVHPDQQAFAFVPGTNGSTFLLGNDGGVYTNTNRGDLAAWKQLNTSFSTNQFYAGQIGPDFAGGGMGGNQWLFGGMQDNGNSSWDSRTADLTSTGRSVGGDGFFTTFDPLAGGESTGWWLSEYTYGSLYCSSSGRGRAVLQLPLRPAPDRQRRLERALPARHPALHQRPVPQLRLRRGLRPRLRRLWIERPVLDPLLAAPVEDHGERIDHRPGPGAQQSEVRHRRHQRRQALVDGNPLQRHQLHPGRGQHLDLRLHAEQLGHLARRRLDQRRAAQPGHPGRGCRSDRSHPHLRGRGRLQREHPHDARQPLPVQVERHGLDADQQDRQPAQRPRLGRGRQPAQPQTGFRRHLLRLLLHGRHRRGHARLGPLPVGPAEHRHQISDDRPRPVLEPAAWDDPRGLYLRPRHLRHQAAHGRRDVPRAPVDGPIHTDPDPRIPGALLRGPSPSRSAEGWALCLWRRRAGHTLVVRRLLQQLGAVQGLLWSDRQRERADWAECAAHPLSADRSREGPSALSNDKDAVCQSEDWLGVATIDRDLTGDDVKERRKTRDVARAAHFARQGVAGDGLELGADLVTGGRRSAGSFALAIHRLAVGVAETVGGAGFGVADGLQGGRQLVRSLRQGGAGTDQQQGKDQGELGFHNASPSRLLSPPCVTQRKRN